MYSLLLLFYNTCDNGGYYKYHQQTLNCLTVNSFPLVYEILGLPFPIPCCLWKAILFGKSQNTSQIRKYGNQPASVSIPLGAVVNIPPSNIRLHSLHQAVLSTLCRLFSEEECKSIEMQPCCLSDCWQDLIIWSGGEQVWHPTFFTIQ